MGGEKRRFGGGEGMHPCRMAPLEALDGFDVWQC